LAFSFAYIDLMLLLAGAVQSLDMPLSLKTYTVAEIQQKRVLESPLQI